MAEEIPNDSSFDLSKITTSDVLSTLDGIPLPPTIKKSLWKSVGSLITGLVEWPVAYLEAKTEALRGETAALSLIRQTASQAVANEFGQDKGLIDRSVNYYGSKLLKEQINRESITKKAIEELTENPPEKDSTEEIDSDWLDMFSRIAETKSNEDVQLFLSKILAGEIRNPGTFSPRTIQTLSLLDRKTAEIFQAFCNVSFNIPSLSDNMTFVIWDPFDKPGMNGLKEIGLSYENLTQLQDYGVVQYEFDSTLKFPLKTLELPIIVGNTNLRFKTTEELPEETLNFNILNFSQVGIELRKVLHITSNPIYNEKFIEWIIGRFKLIQVAE
ncbi:DUF2806 domain-containing protein [Spirosoma agri]|uniref:DUF2806 domain-containing protein n=1 Tax=Spirosoma agri TaxID=1987381 RepID=A0A6M0IJC5_9BACT|nr:DUF2806 domain-containing protein [Spirosoma agri]NEU67922.1 DUF2806 domain-containing protein [Spirosoma agri]